ncbi:MAG: aminotransferase class I/II-fold pyridoxal phosphate-dependent enzyme, partial [Myxococcales bacterium]
VRSLIDRQGDLAMEAAVADWIEEGELARHVRTMHRVYRERRDALVDLIERKLGGSLVCEAPRGGIAIWARGEPGRDLDAWVQAAGARGVVLRPGRHYTFDGSDPGALRLTFARLTVPELTRAVTRLAECRPRS